MNEKEIAELGLRLKELLKGYQEALLFLQSQDDAVMEISTNPPLQAELGQKVTRIRRRPMAKGLALWFMEAHIRRRLESIASQLRILCYLTITDQTNKPNTNIDTLNSYIEQLDRAVQISFHWNRVRAIFFNPTLIPSILLLFSVFSSQVFGGFIDLTEAEGLSAFVTDLLAINLPKIGIAIVDSSSAQVTKDFGEIAGGAVVTIFLLIGAIFSSRFIVERGYKIKKIIFAGGRTVTESSIDEWGVNMHNGWTRLPDVNIYDMEKVLFRMLRLPIPVEHFVRVKWDIVLFFPLTMFLTYLAFKWGSDFITSINAFRSDDSANLLSAIPLICGFSLFSMIAYFILHWAWKSTLSRIVFRE